MFSLDSLPSVISSYASNISAAQLFVVIVILYFTVSLLLLWNPTLLHKAKNVDFLACHISHRGGAAEAFENTLGAFRKAKSCGTDMFELDVRLTKDKKVVVVHDSHLRSAGIDAYVGDFNYKDLPLYLTRVPVEFYPGFVYSGSEGEDRKIPLLVDIFKCFPSVPINIDIKDNDDFLISEVNQMIIQFKREAITVWGNSDDTITQKCYKLNPNVKLFFSKRRVMRMLILFYTGLLPFFPIKETHLEIFTPLIYLDPSWEQYPPADSTIFLTLPIYVVKICHYFLLKKSLISHLAKRGIHTYVWVVNDERIFDTVFKTGVTGIMTDRPTKLREFLDAHPIYDKTLKR